MYRINKALYGLKQAPRTWEQDLGGFLSKRGFKRCVSDQALYTRHDKRGLSMVLIYVDDLMLITDSKHLMSQLKGELGKGYKLKDPGPISAYLGMQVTRDTTALTLTLGLPKNIGDLQDRFLSC